MSQDSQICCWAFFTMISCNRMSMAFVKPRAKLSLHHTWLCHVTITSCSSTVLQQKFSGSAIDVTPSLDSYLMPNIYVFDTLSTNDRKIHISMHLAKQDPKHICQLKQTGLAHLQPAAASCLMPGLELTYTAQGCSPTMEQQQGP